jgi:hypothetical protein
VAQTLKPNHIGIAREGDWYVITAEFREGYFILGYYETFAKAKRALPGVKRNFLECLEGRP